MKHIFIYILLINILLASCTAKKEVTTNETPEVESNELALSPDQLKVLALQLGQTQMQEMNADLKVQGKIDLPPQNVISVNFPLGGFLKSTKLIPGMKVSKGEVIAVMEDQGIVQLQQDYLLAKTKVELSRFEFERQQSLMDANAGTSKAYQQASADLKSQSVGLRALEEKLKLIGIDPHHLSESSLSGQIPIRSNINGYVSKVNVNTGKYVQPTETLFELIDPEDIHVALTIFEKDLPYIKKGDRVKISMINGDGAVHLAEVILVNKDLGDDRTATAHCHFKSHPKELLPGMFVDGELAVTTKSAQTLPDEAIVRFGNAEYVFVKQKDGHFKMTAVKTGLTKNGRTEIEHGLENTNGDVIVLNNAYKLLGLLKNAE